MNFFLPIPDSLKHALKYILGYLFIKNVFKTSYAKSVLISYIIKPFKQGVKFHHTNYGEAIVIAETFRDLGYNVDIVQFNYLKKLNFIKYDVVFGLGDTLEYILKNRKNNKPFVIYHGTGSHHSFSNTQTLKRLQQNKEETGKLLFTSTRLILQLQPLQLNFSDLIVLYGNEATKETYLPYTSTPIELINGTAYNLHQINVKEKDFEACQKNFLWFGSSGSIHKGLDLLLVYFKNNPHLNLHVCGPIEKGETDFFAFYKPLLLNKENIFYHGFVNINSEKFAYLMKVCAFTILPSCSEGCATSVLTTMVNGGLIPIVTIASGINLENFGIEIKYLNNTGIQEAIDVALSLPLEELKRRSNLIVTHTKEKYNIPLFKNRLKEILIQYNLK